MQLHTSIPGALTSGGSSLLKFAPLAAAALLASAFIPAATRAQQADQKTFSSAEGATKALVDAARNDDEKALVEILGPEAKELVSSGDATQDAENRDTFVRRYEEMHRLVREPDSTTTLYIGAENWPLPIPIVKKDKTWYFDTAAGKKEILYRRIGRNEISTIRVCQELAAAQKEYFSARHEYAQKFLSDEGKQDGLYWKVSAGEQPSPIGPLVADAEAEGYKPTHDGSPASPYRGYFYRILDRQGANALGGAKSYIASGKMTGGFAVLAYPAEYRSSGVMSFLVGKDGVVYRKDLGANTATIAKAMKSYNPDSTWKKDEDQQEAAATKDNSH